MANNNNSKVKRVCECCKAVHFIFPSRVKRNRFCSRLCANKNAAKINGEKTRGLPGKKGINKGTKHPWLGTWNKLNPGTGDKNPAWKGGVTPINMKIRASKEYAEWRKAVFKRDNFTCQFCSKKGGDINADHIKPFATYPDLRLELSNGRTLCVPCHRTTFVFMGNQHKSLLKLNELYN